MQKDIRLLAAIMFSDIVGYTAMMQHDEQDGNKKRKRYRKVLENLTTKHQGKIVQYYGDGALSIFGSAVEAVKCAVEIQNELLKEPKVPLRIGLHTGDIVYNDDGAYGDGVNVASRVENLSVPGGVLISEKVYDEIINHPEFSTVSIGKFELKNIKHPVKLYAISNEGLSIPPLKEENSTNAQKTISHYKILEKLGSGGMGVVYKAKDLKLDRFVALKFLPPSFTLNDETKRRFIQEAKAASLLDHPNICTIYEIDETEDGQMFIAMACYEGETLREKIENGLLEIREVIDIIMQIAEGLSKAHEKNIIHRDIKPTNIFITSDGVVKLLDFGLAKIAGQPQITKTTGTVGTAAYMSPEQAKGQSVNIKTDIWSLGVVFFEMLTCNKPFKGEYEQAIIYSIINESPDWDELYNQNVPDELVDVIKRMLNKDISDRFDSNTLLTLFKKIDYGVSIPSESKRLRIFPFHFNISYLYKNKWKIALIIIPLLIIFLFLQLFPDKKITLKPTDFVVVANLENMTNERYFDHSLNEALKVSLRQSSFINPLPKYKVQSALTYMKLSPDYSLDKNTAISVAIREGAAFVILGNIAMLGNNFILTSEIVDPHSGETIIIKRKEVENVEDVLKGMDELIGQIRKDLGEAVEDIDKLNTPLAQVTTPSIQALDLYSRGNQLEAQGKYREAIELKEQAVLIDSLFVMAISDLSYDYQKIGDYEKSLYYHNKILPLIERVSLREKYSILVTYYGPSFEMDYEEAFQIAQNWITLYPNDAIAYATLGHMAMFAGRFKLALSANEQAIKLDSSVVSTCLNNSGFAFALMGNHKEALKSFNRSKKYRPDYINIDIYIAQVYWIQGQLDSAETILLNIIEGSDKLSELKIRSHLAALYHTQGRLVIALDQCTRAIEICRKFSFVGEEAYFHYLYGSIEAERGNFTNSITTLNEANRLCVSPYFEYFLTAATFSEIGKLKNTSILVKKIQTLDSKNLFFINRRESFINYLTGMSSFIKGNYKEAITYFQLIDWLYIGDPVYLMAQYSAAECFAKYDFETAIDKFSTILNKRGEIIMSFLPSVRNSGFWKGKLLTYVHFELGKLYLEIKDTTNAIQQFKSAHDCWIEADDDFPKLIALKEILASLEIEDINKIN